MKSVRAASYSRKSTEQNVTDDAKSVTRQAELARAFAEQRGWAMVAEYRDDGVSGRLRAKLVNRNKMLAAAMAEEFSVLIVRDLDRLSRNDEELPGLVYTLRDAGVDVWCYADGQKVDTRTALSRLMLNVKSYSGTAETEKASERTREQKRGRYAKTANVDGRVYGYRNVGNAGQRSREINPTEAKVVKRIFRMSADGYGLLRVVRTLNNEKIPSPSGRGWCTSGVREMLRRDLYRGISVYGKTKWEWRDGGKFKVDVPESEWLRVPAPELRIIDDSLWQRVQQRIEQTRETYPGRRTNGRLQGRREAGLISQHLLAGFLRCGLCGGNLIATARSGRGGVKKHWICTTAHTRGQEVCANVKGVPYELLTNDVIETFRGTIFNPRMMAQMLSDKLAEHAAAPDAAKEEAQSLRSDIAKLERQIANLVEAIGDGEGDARALKASIIAKEREQIDLQAKLEHLDGLQRAAESFDPAAWMAEQAKLLEDVKVHFAGFSSEETTPSQRARFTEASRRILRVCLPAPLVVCPAIEGGWVYEGDGRLVTSDLQMVMDRVRGHIRPETVEQRKVQGCVSSGRTNDPNKMVPPG